MPSASSGASQQKNQTKPPKTYKRKSKPLKTGENSEIQKNTDDSQSIKETADEQLVQSTLMVLIPFLSGVKFSDYLELT